MATAVWTTPDLDKPAVQKKMATPKRASSLNHWIKEARRAIPEIPNFETGSVHCQVEVEQDYIKINWPNKGWLLIDRTTRKAL